MRWLDDARRWSLEMWSHATRRGPSQGGLEGAGQRPSEVDRRETGRPVEQVLTGWLSGLPCASDRLSIEVERNEFDPAFPHVDRPTAATGPRCPAASVSARDGVLVVDQYFCHTRWCRIKHASPGSDVTDTKRQRVGCLSLSAVAQKRRNAERK